MPRPNIDRTMYRYYEQWGRPAELVHPLVRDDGERGRVEEDVVVLVLRPERQVHVACAYNACVQPDSFMLIVGGLFGSSSVMLSPSLW